MSRRLFFRASLLLLALALTGCGIAGVVIGNVIGAISGSSGIYQRREQTAELREIRDKLTPRLTPRELADLEEYGALQVRSRSDRVRDEVQP